MASRGRSGRELLGPAILVVVVVLVTAFAGRSGSPAPTATTQGGTTVSAAGAVVDFVNISATSALSYVPNTVSVTPGATVHLIVTQEANFLHNFVLSSVANFTLPTSDDTPQLEQFFHAHPPIVNLSLGATPGAETFANFTAPPVGTYEFVCLQPGHFAAGMHGVLTSGAPGGSTGTSLLSPVVLVAIGVVILVVVAAAIVLARRSRRPPATPPVAPAAPPASP
jgi:uncharacterized cupredoxin-like copper-binding protein